MSATAFTGGSILTMDGALPDPDVVVVEGGRIVAVGERAMLDAYPGAEVHDLGGRVLTPGFIDAHNHLSVAALHPRWRDVSAAQSLDELLEMVRAQAAEEPDAPWVRVCDWDEWKCGVYPTAAALDSLGIDRPIIVAHYSLHQCVVSSAGLDALEIGRTTPDPAAGRIGREGDGAANGLLLERAWSYAHAKSMAGYCDPDGWAEHIVARAKVLFAEGITAVHDAACSPGAEAVYRSMAAAGTLPLSVLGLPHPAAILVNDLGDRLDGPPTGDGDEWFRIGHAKFFADGAQEMAVDATVAGEPIQMGLTMDDMHERVVDAVKRGWRVAVHAIGNVAVGNAIEALRAGERARRDDDHRFRIEHASVASRAQAAEMAALGVSAVMQPAFVEVMGNVSQGVSFDEHTWLPAGDYVEAGVNVAGSSDDPCAPFPVLWGSGLGATRCTSHGHLLEPDQALPIEDWLRAYTAGAAYAGGQEGERGSLTPGKRADLVVIDGPLDPHAVPKVAETWVAGERVYTAG